MVAGKKVLLFVLVCGLNFMGVKATTMVKPDLNIAVVSVGTIVKETKEGININNELMGKYKTAVEGAQKQERELGEAVKKFKAEESMLSPAAREERQKGLTKMERDYKNKAQESQEELNLAAQKAQEKLGAEIVEAATKMAQAQGLDLVFDKESGRVLYSSEKADYTLQMVQLMDEKYEEAHVKKPTAVNTADSNGNKK